MKKGIPVFFRGLMIGFISTFKSGVPFAALLMAGMLTLASRKPPGAPDDCGKTCQVSTRPVDPGQIFQNDPPRVPWLY